MTPEPEPGIGAAEDGELWPVFTPEFRAMFTFLMGLDTLQREGEDADKYAASAADIINNIGDEYIKCLMLTK